MPAFRPRHALKAAGAALALGAACLVAPSAHATTAPTATNGTSVSDTDVTRQKAVTTLVMPKPSGPSPVGTHLLHLRDEKRPDPFFPDRRRELMVQLWYPAASPSATPALYASPAERTALDTFFGVPAGAHSGPTNSTLDARMAPGVRPVVMFSHGLCGFRTDSSIVAEDLASRGYLVAAVGHTGESDTVQFPGGRVVKPAQPLKHCTAGADPFSEEGSRILSFLLRERVKDMRFVADDLVALNAGSNPDASGRALPAGLVGSFDAMRIGVYGHSFGGATAAAVVRLDPRFVAAVNLDGMVAGDTATEGTAKPVLAVGSSYHTMEFDPTWGTWLPALRGWHRWFEVSDAGHYRFIDIGGSVRALGLQPMRAADPEQWTAIFGDVGDIRSQQINRQLVRGMFDKTLRNRTAPILQDPTTHFANIVDRTGEIERAG